MRILFALLVLLVLGLSYTSSAGVYVFDGNPYDGGHFSVETQITTIDLWEYEGVKYHCVVHLPKVPGTYSIFYFIGGLGGIIPAETYSDLLKRMASHGYIIIGVDHILGGVFPPAAEEVLAWLQVHLQGYINKHAPGVIAAWDHIGLGGHSGGAQSVLDMVLKDHKIANATLFLEGGWIKSPEVSRINFTHPGLVYATEFATRRSLILPQCGSNGQAEELFQDWMSPRVLMNVSSYGHCDILDPLPWEGCHFSDFCYTDATNNRTLYRQFTQGLFSAFLGYYVQGNKKMLPYFTDQSTMLGIKFIDYQVDVSSNKRPENKEERKKVSQLAPFMSLKESFWQLLNKKKKQAKAILS